MARAVHNTSSHCRPPKRCINSKPEISRQQPKATHATHTHTDISDNMVEVNIAEGVMMLVSVRDGMAEIPGSKVNLADGARTSVHMPRIEARSICEQMSSQPLSAQLAYWLEWAEHEETFAETFGALTEQIQRENDMWEGLMEDRVLLFKAMGKAAFADEVCKVLRPIIVKGACSDEEAATFKRIEEIVAWYHEVLYTHVFTRIIFASVLHTTQFVNESIHIHTHTHTHTRFCSHVFCICFAHNSFCK